VPTQNIFKKQKNKTKNKQTKQISFDEIDTVKPRFWYNNERLVSNQSQQTGPSNQSEQSSSQRGGV